MRTTSLKNPIIRMTDYQIKLVLRPELVLRSSSYQKVVSQYPVPADG